MVEVFKTVVQTKTQSEELISVLSELFPDFKINFDLSDCDRILRVEGNDLPPYKITEILNTRFYQCDLIE